MKAKLLFFSTLFLALLSCQNPTRATGGTADETNAANADTFHQVTLLFAGDLMQHQGQINAAKMPNGTFDYNDCFALVKDEVSRHDIAIANLEVTLPGPPYKGYPQFRCPDEFLAAVWNAGFDVMLTANNHSCDSYKAGIERTIAVLDSLGTPHLGTYANASTRAKDYPLIIERNGIRIALLNYTYDTNGIPVPDPCVVNLIDKQQMAADIARAKEMQPDVIIANMHWGIEYVLTPSQQQRELADWLIQQGVDHVIGSHPHVVQPVEVRTDSDGRKHLVVWSLGNFISNMTKENTEVGLMVRMELTKKNATTTMTDCGYTLTFCSRPLVSGRRVHTILPSSYPQEQMKQAERQRFNQHLGTIRRLFQKHNQGIEEYTF